MTELPGPLPKGSEVLKRFSFPGDAKVVARRRWKPVLCVGQLRKITPEHHDAIRILKRQRPQECRIHDAEDRGVGANSQRESEHRNRGKAGPLYQTAKAVTNVLN